MEVTKTRRIVLLGKTGSGKSSLANTIFGENDVFKISHTLNSETKGCQAETRTVNGRSITLIDTPGLFDTDMSEENLKTEIVRCITECAPGPHAFLILLKVERFTEQENDVIGKIREYFSEEAFKYAAVVFTHGEQLPEGMTIEQCVSQNNHVKDLMKKCGDRCHVIDNKYWTNNQPNEYRSNQVAELLNTINNIVMENNRGCYTNEMLQTVEREIQQEEERLRLSVTMSEISEQDIREQAKVNVLKKLSIRLAGTATGVLLGALLGVPVMITLVVEALMEIKSPTAAEAAGIAVGAALTPGLGVAAGVEAVVAAAAGGTAGTGLVIAAGVAATAGAVVGGCVGYFEAEKANSVREAAKNTANTMWDDTLQRFKKLQINKSEDKESLLKEKDV